MSRREDAKIQDLESPFLTLPEAAAYARCSVRTIQRRLETGLLTRHGLGAKPLVRRDELAQLLAPAKRKSA